MKTCSFDDTGEFICFSWTPMNGSVDKVYSSPEYLITIAARVCHDREYKAPNDEADKKLIKNLLKHRHMKPFDFPTITWRVVLPIYVERQFRVYRSMTALERSMRSEAPIEYSYKEFLPSWQADALKNYESMKEKGYPREVARAVLPVGSFTTIICQFTCRGALHMFEERLTKEAQQETRFYAQLMFEDFEQSFPFVAEAFKELNPNLLYEKGV